MASLTSRKSFAFVPEAAAGMLAVLLAIAVWLGATYTSQDAWVRHARQVKAAIGDLWSAIQDAELGRNGYLATNDPAYLQPFIAAKAETPRRFDALAALLADNPRRPARSQASGKSRMQDSSVWRQP